MLYAHNLTTPQRLTLPLLYGGAIPEQLGEMELQGTTSLQRFTIPVEVIDRTALTVDVELDLTQATPGEYRYTLGGISSGLLMVLDYVGLKQYAQSINYKQYGETNQ